MSWRVHEYDYSVGGDGLFSGGIVSVFRVIDTNMIHYDTDGYIEIPQRYRIVSIVSIVYGYGVIPYHVWIRYDTCIIACR